MKHSKNLLSIIMALAMVISSVGIFLIPSQASVFDDWGYEMWPEGEMGKKKGYQAVEALYFTSEPTIDGSITEAEWGEVTRRMNSIDAATYSESKSIFASYFYWDGAVSGSEYTGAGIDYDIWLRWDSKYFYIGVKVRDYDGHSLKNGLSATNLGDSMQFRIDPNYPFFDSRRDRLFGWSSRYEIPNIVSGYSQLMGGFVECYDYSNGVALTEYSKPMYEAVKVAVAPAGSDYSADTLAGYTTYEMALPWNYVFENGNYYSGNSTPYTLRYSYWDGKIENGMGGIGVELGMTLAVYNAAEGNSSTNSYLTWGSGVAGANESPSLKMYNQTANTCTGANMVLLSDAVVSPAEGSYTKYDPSELDKTEEIMNNAKYDEVYKDYLSFDFDAVVEKDDLTTLTYDSASDMNYWGNDIRFQGSIRDEGGEHGGVLVFDRAISPYDTSGCDKKGVYGGPDIYTDEDPIPSFYIETSGGDEDSIWYFPTSYTFEFDVRYLSTDISVEGRDSVLALWFGGGDGVSYQCGYSFATNQFMICPMMREMNPLVAVDYDLVEDQWYNWKFQYDNETCTVRFYVDNELIFNMSYRYFYYSSLIHEYVGTPMYAWFINTQVEFDNVKIYNFYDYGTNPPADEPDPEPEVLKGDVNGDGSVNVSDIYALKTVLLDRLEYAERADITLDGKVNLMDMFALKSLLLNS